jgi:hypothetical protein
MTIQEAIREAIRLSGRKQINVAKDVFPTGTPASQLCNMLRKKDPRPKNPSSETIRRLSIACGVLIIPDDADGWTVVKE